MLSTLVEECLEALVSDKGGREGMTSEGGVREVGQLFRVVVRGVQVGPEACWERK